MHGGWLERVADDRTGVQDSDKTVQNLTDCADESFVGTVCEEINQAEHIRLRQTFPSKFWD